MRKNDIRAYVGPILALLAAVLAASKDVQSKVSPTAIAWASLVVALGAFLATVNTIVRQRRQLALQEIAWRSSLQAALRQATNVLRYIAFAAGQFERQITDRGLTHQTPISQILPGPNVAGYSGKTPPTLDELIEPAWTDVLAAFRVDPPRSIGGPWTVPFGQDVTKTFTSVLADEVPKAVDGLRNVQTMYGHQLPATVTSNLARAIDNAMPDYLANLSSFVTMRSMMEDSRFPDVRLMGSMGAPSVDEFRAWLTALIELERELG